MALNIFKGTISHIGEVTRGTGSTGKEWARMNILIDIAGYQGSIYKIQFQVGTDKVEEVLKYKVGDKVEIASSIYAREWNGKWYNNIDLVSIKPQEQTRPATPTSEQIEDMPEGTEGEDGGMPF